MKVRLPKKRKMKLLGNYFKSNHNNSPCFIKEHLKWLGRIFWPNLCLLITSSHTWRGKLNMVKWINQLIWITSIKVKIVNKLCLGLIEVSNHLMVIMLLHLRKSINSDKSLVIFWRIIKDKLFLILESRIRYLIRSKTISQLCRRFIRILR